MHATYLIKLLFKHTHITEFLKYLYYVLYALHEGMYCFIFKCMSTFKISPTPVKTLLQIKTSSPQLDQGKELDASIRRSLALVNIAENNPPETWTYVYIDGSATKAITDGVAGIIIQYPSGATQIASSVTGKHCTKYRAETEPLKLAAILVKDSLEPCSPTVFLTDALSVLEALQTNKSPLLAT